MKLFVEDIAVEVVKTLLTSDQRELIDEAGRRGMTTVKAVSVVSFDFAEAFLAEYEERFGE